MQQTLEITTSGYGDVQSIGPASLVPKYLVSLIPEGTPTSWADLHLSDVDIVRQLNEGGWKTLSVVVLMENGRYKKEIWLTREVDESTAPAS